LGRRREGLLESLLDPPVGVLDQALELAQRGLEILALRLELLDVLERLLVLGLRERVHRAELLAAALQALELLVQVVTLSLVKRGLGRLRFEPKLLRQGGERRLGVLGMVAGALGLDLAAGDGLAALAQLGVDA